MKKNFKNYPIDNLAQGINVENFPTELQDGEGLEVINFDLIGKELVTSKSHELVESTGTNINGLYKLGEDIYTIRNANVYKNDEVLYLNNEYTVTFGALDGNPFSISIDGVSKVYKMGFFNNEALAQSTLLTDLQADFPGYTITGAGAVKTISNGGVAISITNPNLVKTITLNSWDTDAKIGITIDGTTYTRDGSESATAADVLDWVVTQLPALTYETKRVSSTLHIGRVDATAIAISEVSYNRYTYLVRATSNSINLSDINLGTGGSGREIQQDKFYLNLNGTLYTRTIGFTNSWSLESISYVFSNVLGTQTIADGNTDGFIMMDYMYGQYDGTYTKGAISTFGSPSGSDYWWYEHTLKKTDYSQLVFTENALEYIVNSSLDRQKLSSRLTYAETNHLASISVGISSLVTYSVDNDSLGINSGTIYTIDVTPYGILLTSSGLGYSAPIFIDSAGTPHAISDTNIGNPNQGIIYKGRTILGGTGGRLIFSKPYSSGTPADIYTFGAYSAGSQIVGQATPITGIITGEQGLYLFKEDEIYYSSRENDETTTNASGVVNGATFNFIFDKIVNNGIKNVRAVTKVEQDLFYFDYKNRVVRRLGYEENKTTIRDKNISRKVEKILKEIPDDGTGGINYSPLIHLTYKYPHLYVFFPDADAITHTSFTTTAIPNRCLQYSFDTEGWTELDNFVDLVDIEFPFLSSGDVVAMEQLQRIYQLSKLDSASTSQYTSGEYTMSDDVRNKKIGEFQIVGELEGGKSIEVELLRDGENIIISNDVPTTKRVITGPGRFVERIDLYELGLQSFQYKITTTASTGMATISDVSFKWNEDESFSNYY